MKQLGGKVSMLLGKSSSNLIMKRDKGKWVEPSQYSKMSRESKALQEEALIRIDLGN
jgi:hypothetical protein